jgi:hypothetical protein
MAPAANVASPEATAFLTQFGVSATDTTGGTCSWPPPRLPVTSPRDPAALLPKGAYVPQLENYANGEEP